MANRLLTPEEFVNDFIAIGARVYGSEDSFFKAIGEAWDEAIALDESEGIE